MFSSLRSKTSQNQDVKDNKSINIQCFKQNCNQFVVGLELMSVLKWILTPLAHIRTSMPRTYGPTDPRTHGRTDRPSYRDARTHLKIRTNFYAIRPLKPHVLREKSRCSKFPIVKTKNFFSIRRRSQYRSAFQQICGPFQVDITAEQEVFIRMVELWFLFCLIWSVCGSVDEGKEFGFELEKKRKFKKIEI